jgi:hypothetical protein
MKSGVACCWLSVVCLIVAGSCTTTSSKRQATDGGGGAGAADAVKSTGTGGSGGSAGTGGGGSGSHSGTGGADRNFSTGGVSGGSGTGGSRGMDAGANDAPTTDAKAKADDAGADSASHINNGDAGVCGSCDGASICVENQTIGGALFLPNDAGQCSDGRIIVPEAPQSCSSPPSHGCAQLPPACTTAAGSVAVATCVCAPSICAAGRQCSDPTPTLVRCLLRAP